MLNRFAHAARSSLRRLRGEALSAYALLAGLIAVGALGGVVATGDRIDAVFCAAATSIAVAVGAEPEDCSIGSAPVETVDPGPADPSDPSGGGDEDEPDGPHVAFLPANGVEPGATTISLPAVVGGLDAPLPGFSSTGSFILNGLLAPSGAVVEDGDSIQLVVEAPLGHGASESASFTIAGVTGSFIVTTRAAATDPVGFDDFAPVTGAQRNMPVTSSAQVVAGLDVPAPISVAGGAYAIDGGAFTSAPGTIASGQSVVVQATSSGAFTTPVTATLTIGTVSARFVVTTEDIDTTPDGFVDFPPVNLALTGTEYQSSPQVISGLNTTVTASIAAGAGADLGPISFSVNGGSFGPGPVVVGNGDSIVVRLTTGGSYAAAYSARLTVGSMTRSFAALTAGADVDPDNLADFPTITGAATASAILSAPSAPIAGINTGAPISITGGRYAIDGGSFTDAPGQIEAGSTVVVELTTGAGFLAPHVATLAIGGVSADFRVVTAPADTTPDGLTAFAGTVGAEINAYYPSETKAILGINAPAPVTISGGSNAQFQVLDAALAVVRSWSAAPANVPVGGSVQVRQMLATYSASSTATLSVGGVTATHALATRAGVTTPTSLTNFAPVTGANPSTEVVSAAQTVYGIEIPVNATVSLAGGGEAAFRVNNGAGWSAYSAADKTANIGSQVQVRIATPATFATTSTATLQVGGAQASFAVTTRVATTTPTGYANFATVSGANPSAVTSSAVQAIAGLEAAASVSISGGSSAQFQVTNSSNTVTRAWGTAATTVPVGGKVQVRQTASATYGATVTTTLTVGGVARTFAVTTRAATTTPTGYANFATISGANPSSVAPSAVQTIAGLEAAANVSISGGSSAQFQVTNSSNTVTRAWGTAATTVPVGGKVQVRQTASATYGATVTTTLTVGGVARTFAVTTRAANTTPTGYASFNAVTVPAPGGQIVASNVQAISGIEAPASVSLAGGNQAQFQVTNASNGVVRAWGTAATTVPVGGKVQVRQRAPVNGAVCATLTVGGVQRGFCVNTN